jgi:DNA (cytosine-5)-methyltransferase 1
MRTIDLFAGCGGLSLGFQQAGFEIVAAFDNWQPAIEVYRDNFEHPIINLDLSQTLDYDIFKQYRPEIIIGSPPCQDFSSAGKRNENLGRANLTITFAEIIADVKPSWFLMENVDRIEKSQTFSRAKKILRNHGYGLTEKILNACYCGVPQMRKRLFLIGKIEENEQFLNQAIERNQSPKPMTIFDYLGSNLNLEYYYRHPRSYQRRGIFSIYEPSPTIRGVNRPIPKTYQKHSGDACDPNPYLRALTTRERSYLQTFPKNFLFKGNKSNLEQMIGNAVPVNLAKYIGECIMKYQSPTQKTVNYQQLQLF